VATGGVATNQLTLENQVNTGDWDTNDWYTCAEPDGSYSGNANGKYEQTYAVHFDTQYTGGGSSVTYEGDTWGVYSTTSNWKTAGGFGAAYGIEEETIRKNDGTEETFLRIWIAHNETNADAIGNGQVRLWYPIYFGSGVSGQGENQASNENKGLAVFWPMFESSSSSLGSAPGRYQPRDGYFWTPNGRAVIPAAGSKNSTTITFS
jgi:hypothetical protein